VAIGFTLKVAKGVIMPLMIAWLLSYTLSPAVRFLERCKLPTSVSLFIVLFLLLGVVFLGGLLVYDRINAFAEAYPRYEQRFSEISKAVTDRINLPAHILDKANIGERIGTFLVRVSGSVMSFISNLSMIFIFLVFLLLSKPYFKDKIRNAFSPGDAERLGRINESVSRQISGYLVIHLFTSLATGLLVWGALALLGIDFAATWGLLAFFLDWIPNIGSVIASVLPVLVAIIQFYPAFWPPVICLLLMLVIQLVIGNVVSPKLTGDWLNLSPVVILLSLLFWGWLWGIVGALLSVPFTAAIMITCENIESLRPISVMMSSGRKYRKGA
jgi:predicted PurR-regulated permease PerM